MHPHSRFPKSSMVKCSLVIDRRLFRLRVKQYPLTQRTPEKAEAQTYANWALLQILVQSLKIKRDLVDETIFDDALPVGAAV